MNDNGRRLLRQADAPAQPAPPAAAGLERPSLRAGSIRRIFRCISSATRICRPIPLGVLRGALAFARRARRRDEEMRARGALRRFRAIAGSRRATKAFARRRGRSRADSFSAAAKRAPGATNSTAEQVARIEAEHAPMMRRLGYALASAAALARAG